ncbi:hypothetical protein [Neobacillus bataviensis]|nr:hypothetical protein [Neobacillus bataviensis]
MGATKVNQKKKAEKETNVGTWISVGVLAAVILFTYLVLFGLYMDRV